MMAKPHIVILGAGPAGLGAAFQLTRRGLAQVTVLERNSWVGGNAGSFELAGMRVDYGSHRLHPSCDPAVLRDIRSLLGGDLLDRPRHGRIRLQGRWIHFPLKPLDLCLKLPPSFMCGVAGDLLAKVFARCTESIAPKRLLRSCRGDSAGLSAGIFTFPMRARYGAWSQRSYLSRRHTDVSPRALSPRWCAKPYQRCRASNHLAAAASSIPGMATVKYPKPTIRPHRTPAPKFISMLGSSQ